MVHPSFLNFFTKNRLGKSVIARAKNGTGKTGAFVIPILEKIDTSRNTIQGTTSLLAPKLKFPFSFDFGSYQRTCPSNFFHC